VLDRLASFRVLYAAFFAFVLLDYFSVRAAEMLLNRHFQTVVAQSIRVDPMLGPATTQIQQNIERNVRRSRWVRWGGLRVNVIVLAADGLTPLYLGGHAIPRPPDADAGQALREAEHLLPATADVSISLPRDSLLANAILVAYATILLIGLFRYNRALARGEAERLAAAIAMRDTTAERAARIERELQFVRDRLAEVEPIEEGQAEEIHALQRERAALQEKLAEVGRRESALRTVAARSSDLEEERRSLEEMLEEALSDVGRRDEEIQKLQTKLEGAAKAPKDTGGGRAREADLLGKRLRTLYKNLEIDERAIDDLVGLRDADMKLKAEENMKRLSDEPDTAAIRRKVGGLPPHLSIFELGFAGKGRIYYTKGDVRRFRILAIGAKNTQKNDLEYLSRLA
jgi:DNA repair exonuclease SbcCD ATPase subunit